MFQFVVFWELDKTSDERQMKEIIDRTSPKTWSTTVSGSFDESQ